MPRYSYVIAFPVLIALCIGINIQRYPAVSVMLHGDVPDSRWLGRSQVFQFQGSPDSETGSYQGARTNTSESDNFAAGSRDPIPLSGSQRTHSTYSSSYSGSPDDMGANYRSSEPVNRYGNSYNSDSDDDSLYNNASNHSSYSSHSTGYSTSNSTTGRNTESRSASTDTNTSNTSSPSPARKPIKKNPYGFDDDDVTSDAAQYGASSAGEPHEYESIPSPRSSATYDGGWGYGDTSNESSRASYSTSYPDYGGTQSDRSGSNDITGTSSSRTTGGPNANTSNGNGDFNRDTTDGSGYGSSNSYRYDTPAPGYSSVYTPNESNPIGGSRNDSNDDLHSDSDDSTGTQPGTSATTASARPARERPRALTLQEKLELRLATPFSLTPSPSTVKDDHYIPPDFLPSHENGVANRLIVPDAEPATLISPILFDVPGDDGND